ncbi:MAG: hypothetical protein VR65_07030 [Desulfobulbaceae bacterium BRH_c16a]|nr:MAG: hypothetical protein VR65_07030 [Desulfobulbaceae bacterium BRH_c16a]
MPIVFVHGVNNRDGQIYNENESSRNGFLREIVGPALGFSPDKIQLFSPYWGGQGADFFWKMAVLPDPDAKVETFGVGSTDEAYARVVTVIADSNFDGTISVVENAKKDFAGVVDALYAAAMAGATNENEARDLARSYLLASEYTGKNPSPGWLGTAKDSNFVDQLEYGAKVSSEESFGAGGILDSLKEGFSRLINALPDAGSALAGRLGRRQLNEVVTRFAGDAFTYLARRGTKSNPGEIVKIVRDSLRLAVAHKNADDDKLVVIAHSFGGEIVYDILTHFDAELEVDCLVTVGSQVGLFEEMKLYVESKSDVPPNPPTEKVVRPVKLKRWLNVFDLNDVLSFRIEPVFADTSDFAYDTGFGSLSAHGGYFMRPSFYKRLAARLSES